jgi:aspartate/tyrosine/aromatic aminotransferase
MSRKEDLAISKHTLNLYAGDYAKLQSLYSTRVGAAKIIRDIIHAHIRKIEEDAAQKVTLVDVLDLNLEPETGSEESRP